MEKSEIEFNDEIGKYNDKLTGTIILKYNQIMNDELETQFEDPKSICDIMSRFDVIFGKQDVNLIYISKDNRSKKLNLIDIVNIKDKSKYYKIVMIIHIQLKYTKKI